MTFFKKRENQNEILPLRSFSHNSNPFDFKRFKDLKPLVDRIYFGIEKRKMLEYKWEKGKEGEEILSNDQYSWTEKWKILGELRGDRERSYECGYYIN